MARFQQILNSAAVRKAVQMYLIASKPYDCCYPDPAKELNTNLISLSSVHKHQIDSLYLGRERSQSKKWAA